MMIFVGTYTGGPSKGIYSYDFNLKDGSLKQLQLAAETANPSFVAIHPSGRFLYSVGEVASFNGKSTGLVTAFEIDAKNGRLNKINEASSGGTGPCHVSIDKTGKYALVANYGGGSVATLPIAPNGRLGEPSDFVQHTGSSVNKQRQSEPHAHSFNLDANNRYALAADLGLDKILVYEFDARNGKLKPNQPPSGAAPSGGGPRHLAFHPEANCLYVNNELLNSVTSYSYDKKTGTLKQVQTISSLPKDWKGNNSTAEIQVHPSGKFVYCSNRGHDSIAVYKTDGEGHLTYVENESTRGKTPRNFGIDPTGAYLIAANQDSDTLSVYRINLTTGALDPVGSPVNAPKPVCVRFLPLH